MSSLFRGMELVCLRVLASACVLSAGVASAQPNLVIWANTGEDKVTRDERRVSRDARVVTNAAWDGLTVQLGGARNEVVSAAVIIEAPSGATGLSVSLDSLSGPNGAAITTRSAVGDEVFNYVGRPIQLFYVRYLQIKGLSRVSYETYDERHIPTRFQRPWTGDGYGSGQWNNRPDHDKFYPEIAVPNELVPTFDIPVNSNQSLWIDVYIPSNTPPGVYTGQLRIHQSGVVIRTVPVGLQVYDLALPDEPAAKTMLYFSSGNINKRYFGNSYVAPNSPAGAQARLIRDRHAQLAHAHGITLIGDTPLSECDSSADQPCPEWLARFTGALFTAAAGYEGQGTGQGINAYSIGTYGHWPWQNQGEAGMRQHTDAWENWFRQQAPHVERFLYLIDESSDTATIEMWSQWIRRNPGPGRSLPSFATIPLPVAAAETPSLDRPTSTFGVGHPDTWQPLVDRYQSDTRQQFWMYNFHRPATGSMATEDDGIAPRQAAWAQYKKGIDRWFFWESTYYNNYQGGMGETNVFRTAQTFGSRSAVLDPVKGETGWNYSNGDGVLFYPGTDRVYAADSYNVLGPFASLRLKYWRRGLQDVKYLKMAADRDPVRVQDILGRMVPKVLWEYGVNDPNDPTWVRTPISWSTNPDDWDAARRELIDIITGSSTPPSGQLVVLTPMTLSPGSPETGQLVTSSFTVKNVGPTAVSVEYFLSGARDAAGANVDFAVSAPVTLQPGDQYTYQASRSFSTTGTYHAWPAYYDGTTWTELAPHETMVVSESGVTVTRVEDSSPQIARGPTQWTWNTGTHQEASGGTYITTAEAGGTLQMIFTGTGISLRGIKDSCSGQARVQVDGLTDTFDAYTGSGVAWQQVLYTSPTLPQGQHTVTLTVLGTNQASACAAWIYIDSFDIRQ